MIQLCKKHTTNTFPGFTPWRRKRVIPASHLEAPRGHSPCMPSPPLYPKNLAEPDGRSKFSLLPTPTHFPFEALRKPFLSPTTTILCWIRSPCHEFSWQAGTLCVTQSTMIMTWGFVSTSSTNLHTPWGMALREFGGYCHAPPTFYFEKISNTEKLEYCSDALNSESTIFNLWSHVNFLQ